MPNLSLRIARLSLLAALIAGASGAGAQEQDTPSLEELQRFRPACELIDDSGQCVETPGEVEAGTAASEQGANSSALEAANKAAIRRRDQEQRALRELLLQRACSNRSTYCEKNGAPGCAEQLAQMCKAVEQQAVACLRQAASYCAAFPQNDDCLRQRQAQCPSAKRQSIDVLLAKYPKLSAQQAEHVRQVARQMDANLGSWVSDLFRWLGF